jgi:hypothetical protein
MGEFLAVWFHFCVLGVVLPWIRFLFSYWGTVFRVVHSMGSWLFRSLIVAQLIVPGKFVGGYGRRVCYGRFPYSNGGLFITRREQFLAGQLTTHSGRLATVRGVLALIFWAFSLATG